jgi:hypothetical protein
MSQAWNCGRCKHPVILSDIGGKAIVLDLKPRMDGQVAAAKDVHGKLRGRWLKGNEGIRDGETRYRAHPKTCDQPKPAPHPTLF